MSERFESGRKREFKGAIYSAFASVAKALGNGHRLELIDVLSQANRSVEELAHETSMSVANTSQHLQILRRAGLVRASREGVRAVYRLADSGVYDLWRCLREFGEAELPIIDRIVGTFLADRAQLDALSASELQERLGTGNVILIDVRPACEFAAGHIPGALSLPIDELESRLGELPNDAEIVAYCRGRYCVYSDDAVQLLRRHGFRASRLDGGVRDWNRPA